MIHSDFLTNLPEFDVNRGNGFFKYAAKEKEREDGPGVQ